MKHVRITYSNGHTYEFTANELFYKTIWGWCTEIGYCPNGKSRKKWYPIGGKRDDNNDFSDVVVEINDI